MTVWHWIRHGPTHEKNFVGWRDVPADLSDTAQIARLNALLPSEAIVVSSDLIRAVATADVLDTPDRRRLPHDRRLRELDFGDWDGKHFSEVAASHPELSRAYWETPGNVTAPGGESWNDAAFRIRGAVDALNKEHPDAHIIAVAHLGVILTQVQRAGGMTPQQAMGNRIDNLSLTRLAHDRGHWTVQTINHVP